MRLRSRRFSEARLRVHPHHATDDGGDRGYRVIDVRDNGLGLGKLGV